MNISTETLRQIFANTSFLPVVPTGNSINRQQIMDIIKNEDIISVLTSFMEYNQELEQYKSQQNSSLIPNGPDDCLNYFTNLENKYNQLNIQYTELVDNITDLLEKKNNDIRNYQIKSDKQRDTKMVPWNGIGSCTGDISSPALNSMCRSQLGPDWKLAKTVEGKDRITKGGCGGWYNCGGTSDPQYDTCIAPSVFGTRCNYSVCPINTYLPICANTFQQEINLLNEEKTILTRINNLIQRPLTSTINCNLCNTNVKINNVEDIVNNSQFCSQSNQSNMGINNNQNQSQNQSPILLVTTNNNNQNLNQSPILPVITNNNTSISNIPNPSLQSQTIETFVNVPGYNNTYPWLLFCFIIILILVCIAVYVQSHHVSK